MGISDSRPEFIFYDLPAGKPDPRQARPSGEDSRDRVIQKAQKGGTCFYYALQRLRTHYGKFADSCFEKERKFEQLASARRKEYSRVEEEYQQIYLFFEELKQDPVCKHAKINTLEGARRFFEKIKKEQFLFYSLRNIEPNLQFLHSFCQQTIHQQLESFLEEKNHLDFCKIDTLFLQALGEDPEYLYLERQAAHPYLFPLRWDQLNPLERSIILCNFSYLAMIERYGFSASSWNPSQSIEEFIQILDREGPLQINGSFGRNYYQGEPEFWEEQVVGKELLYWPKDPENKNIFEKHAIVVVGAQRKKNQEWVYFWDPQDEDAPKDLQKIYVIPYKQLQEESVNLWCALDEQKKRALLPGVPFAIYSSNRFQKIKN